MEPKLGILKVNLAGQYRLESLDGDCIFMGLR